MSRKNEIISELYQSREFNECIGKMEPQHLQDDLKAEVMLALLEKEDQFIIDIYSRGELKFFTTRIILNLIKSSTSPFYKKYRMNHSPINTTYKEPVVVMMEMRPGQQGPAILPESEITERLRRELEEDKVKAYIQTLYWYDKEIIELYIKLGNYRAIEKETGIPFESCYSTVKKVIKKIRQDVLATQSV